jgi:hypothetical protein
MDLIFGHLAAKLIDEIVPTTHAIIVWGGTSTDRKWPEQHGL